MLRTVRSKFLFQSWRKRFFWPASWGGAFVVTLVFVTLASGLFWLDFFRSYRAEVTVLIVSRAGASGISQDAAGNMAELARTLSFYERVLAGSDLIDDSFAGATPDKRKQSWNDMVSVKRQKGSGVLIVQAVSDTPEQAKRLGRQTAQTMFAVAGLYYNVKTDIDMRIVDGPVVARVLENPALFFVTSILTGLSVTAVFFWLLNMAPGFIGGRRKSIAVSGTSVAPEREYPEFVIGETVPWIDPRKFVPAKPSTLSFENVHQTAKRSHAPANLPASPNRGEPTAYDEMDLPVADEASLPFEFEARSEDVEASFAEPAEEEMPLSSETNAAPELHLGEPTAEEYKRRLNELLSGGR